MSSSARIQQQHQGILPPPPFSQAPAPVTSQQQQEQQQQQQQQQQSMQQHAMQQQQTQSVDMTDANNEDTNWEPTPLSFMQGASPMMTSSPTSVRRMAESPMEDHPPAPQRTSSMPTAMQMHQPMQQEQQLQQSPQLQQLQQQMKQQQQQQQRNLQPMDMLSPPQKASPSSESGKVPFPDQKYAFLLPSTLMPPSVMTSILPAHKKTPSAEKTSDAGGRYKKKRGRKSTRVESPQDCLDRILSLQGYGGMNRVTAEEAQYETSPSPLQLASFGTELVKAVHTSDTDRLSELLETGLSPNPCNKFRDSIVDLVCKRANSEVFRCLVEHGCDLRVCDGFGRTPLHHCCWASEFSPEIAETILRIDCQQLFIEDKRGQTPLEYVRADQASDWVEFLEDNRERFFPVGGTMPPLQAVKEGRTDNYLPNPPGSLPVQLASAISSGQLSPTELKNMDPELRARFK